MWQKMKALAVAGAIGIATLEVTLSPAFAKDFRSDPMPPTASRCAGDQLVWVNTKSHIYHFAGQTWFGHTKEGKYICRLAADSEGDRPTHNGQ
jgi:hypothetical protein